MPLVLRAHPLDRDSWLSPRRIRWWWPLVLNPRPRWRISCGSLILGGNDLARLSWLFARSQQAWLDKQVWTHPKNIWQTAGAAADLWLDGYILDLKATTTPKLVDASCTKGSQPRKAHSPGVS